MPCILFIIGLIYPPHNVSATIFFGIIYLFILANRCPQSSIFFFLFTLPCRSCWSMATWTAPWPSSTYAYLGLFSQFSACSCTVCLLIRSVHMVLAHHVISCQLLDHSLLRRDFLMGCSVPPILTCFHLYNKILFPVLC